MGRLTPEDLGFLFRVCKTIGHLGTRTLTVPSHISSRLLPMYEERVQFREMIYSLGPCCKFLPVTYILGSIALCSCSAPYWWLGCEPSYIDPLCNLAGVGSRRRWSDE